MELLNKDEFNKLPMKEMKQYLIEIINNLSDTHVKELYEDLMVDKNISSLLKNLKQEK